MPSSDYLSGAIVGGGLKLKGAKDSGVKKSRKKKSKNSEDTNAKVPSESRLEEEVETSATQRALADEEQEQNGDRGVKVQIEDDVRAYGKTEAQRRHEERRKKRLDERLKREGVKTHKERVEELNKYLSNLSEHHDMPRIGPG